MAYKVEECSRSNLGNLKYLENIQIILVLLKSKVNVLQRTNQMSKEINY